MSIHLGYKISIGVIVNFNFEKSSQNLSKTALNKIYKQVNVIKEEEFESHRSLYLDVCDATANREWMIRDIFLYLDSDMLKKRFIELVELDKLNIIDAYNKALSEFLKNNQFIPRFFYEVNMSEVYKHIDIIRQRITKRFELMFLQKTINKVKRNFILCVDEFKVEYLDNLPTFIQGIIFKRTKDLEFVRSLSVNFDLPFLMSNQSFTNYDKVIMDGPNKKIIVKPKLAQIQEYMDLIREYTFFMGEHPKYKQSKINIYVPLVDTRLIEKAAYSDWYSGVAPFKTEYMYVTKGAAPTHKEQEEVFVKLLEAFHEKDIYIRIPDFRPERPTPFLGNIYTDKDIYDKFSEIFNVNLLALASAVKITKKEVNICIPMIRLSSEVSFWRDVVEAAFDMYDLPYANLDIMIETESAFEYFEDYDDMDFVIIGLNDLLEEITDDIDRFTDLSKDDMIDILWPHMRDLHQYLRSYKMQLKHIVAGNCLKNPEIFKKFLKSGFTDFSISISEIKLIEEALKEHNEARGKFVGLAAHRIERKAILEVQRTQKKLDDEQAIIDKKKDIADKKAKKQQEIRDKNKEKREIVIKRILFKKGNEEE
jgi:phosphoenolpyruvate-protein phosphotransferase (PTS system enzyme I)